MLKFSTALIGKNLSRGGAEVEASFSSTRPGDWMAYKLFIGDDLELYLNINAKAGKAEFRMKDPEYGDELLRNLAQVL